MALVLEWPMGLHTVLLRVHWEVASGDCSCQGDQWGSGPGVPQGQQLFWQPKGRWEGWRPCWGCWVPLHPESRMASDLLSPSFFLLIPAPSIGYQVLNCMEETPGGSQYTSLAYSNTGVYLSSTVSPASDDPQVSEDSYGRGTILETLTTQQLSLGLLTTAPAVPSSIPVTTSASGAPDSPTGFYPPTESTPNPSAYSPTNLHGSLPMTTCGEVPQRDREVEVGGGSKEKLC